MRCAVIGSSGHYNYLLEGMALRGGKDELVAVAPGRPGEALPACPGHDPRVYESAEVLLRREKPEVVCVNTWLCDQAAWTIRALEFGAAVLSEKPLALTLEDLDRVEKAAEAGPRLSAMFGIRYEPWMMAARRAAQAGLLGDIRLADGQKSYKMGKRGPMYASRATYGGTLPWVAIHSLDLVSWILGEPPLSVAAAHSTQANRGHGDCEATAAMLVTYPGGRMATFRADYLRPDAAPRHDDDRLRLTGDKGTLTVQDQRVFLEPMDGPGRWLPLTEEKPLGQRFLEDVEAESGLSPTAREALSMTRWALFARMSADDGKILRWPGLSR